MDFTAEIEAQDEVIKQKFEAYQAAKERLAKAERAMERAGATLDNARQRREDLIMRSKGLKPYLCGKPYTNTFAGDQYRETVITGIEDETHWWTPTEASAAFFAGVYAYIVALKDDAKTWKALVYLNENASIKAATLKKLLKLPEAP